MDKRTERPIPLRPHEVRGILAGRQTMLRRLVHSATQDAYAEYDDWCSSVSAGVPSVRLWEQEFYRERSRFEVGQHLWAQEAHTLLPRTAYRASIGTGTIDQREHPTDGYTAAVFREGFDRSGRPVWRSSTQMPRWASRLTLEVTGVKVERLQDISEADAEAEGCVAGYNDDASGYRPAVGDFADLWTSIHGPGSWEANPWVTAITFSKVEAAHG